MKQKKLIVITTVFILTIIIIAAALTYSGFFSTPTTVQAQTNAIDTHATSESVTSLSTAINNFSFDMYKQLGSTVNENVFFSPYSIFVALAMTYEGARGDTAEQMKQVLGFNQNDEVSLCSFGRIYNLLNIDAEYTLNTANALWTKEEYPFLDDYLQFIDNYYMGKATDVDFTDTNQALQQINTWVEENTGGKIDDMLSSGDINPATVLILSNAIYFKGLWKTQFDIEHTVDRDFNITSEKIVQVPMMTSIGSEKAYNYSETDNMQILELPYKGDAVSLLIILPKQNNTSSIEQMITADNLTMWIDLMYPKKVDMYIPTFTYETEYNLKEMLIAMGMDIAFSFNADFSGMNGFGGLFIEKVLHKAFIEVNEEGTEAAAATTVHMLESAVEPGQQTIFDANHPFIYLITHKQTNTILFIGKVVDPQ